MKIHSTQMAVAALIAMAAIPAHAQFYVGGSVGRSDVSIDRAQRTDEFLDLGFNSASTTSDDNDTAFRAFVGYQFMPYLAVEGAYVDLGTFGFSTVVDPAGSLSGKTDIKGEELSVVGRLPIGDNFAVYARAGAYSAKTKTTYTAQGSVELVSGAEHQRKRTTKAAYALGASYAFTPNISMRAEWARYSDLGNELTGGQTDANLVSVGMMYSF